MKNFRFLILLPAVLLTMAAPAKAADVTVEVTNMTAGIYFTPLLVAAHDASASIFSPGETASADLEIMAECGDISGLTADMGSAGADTLVNPAGGLLGPGETASGMLSTSPGNDYLSLVAMMLPTNDGFIGMSGLAIPAQAGTYSYVVYGFDAGTEINDELLNTSGCDASTSGIPADPTTLAGENGTGAADTETNTTVHIHRGILGDQDPTGGISDLSSSAHRWLNPVARLVLKVQ